MSLDGEFSSLMCVDHVPEGFIALRGGIILPRKKENNDDGNWGFSGNLACEGILILGWIAFLVKMN